MALAPLSQTILLTEDGSVISVIQQVTVPPARLPPVATPTIINTPGTSMLLGSQIAGFTGPANDLDTRLIALGA